MTTVIMAIGLIQIKGCARSDDGAIRVETILIRRGLSEQPIRGEDKSVR